MTDNGLSEHSYFMVWKEHEADGLFWDKVSGSDFSRISETLLAISQKEVPREERGETCGAPILLAEEEGCDANCAESAILSSIVTPDTSVALAHIRDGRLCGYIRLSATEGLVEEKSLSLASYS